MAYIQLGVAVSMILSSATAATPKAPDSKTPSTKPATTTTQQTKYCLEMEPFTGSRTTTTECMTKEQWAKEGVDVDHLLKQ